MSSIQCTARSAYYGGKGQVVKKLILLPGGCYPSHGYPTDSTWIHRPSSPISETAPISQNLFPLRLVLPSAHHRIPRDPLSPLHGWMGGISLQGLDKRGIRFGSCELAPNVLSPSSCASSQSSYRDKRGASFSPKVFHWLEPKQDL